MSNPVHTSRVLVVRALAPVAIVGALSCGGGGGGSPTAPPSGTLQPPGNLSVGTVSLRDRSVPLSWGQSPGATAYVIEVGSSAGAANLATITTPNASPSFTLTDAPLGQSFVRVRARNDAATSSPSATVPFNVVDFQEFVEALLLGTGPLQAPNDPLPCVNLPGGLTRGVLHGFARGSDVRILVASAVSAGNQQVIREMSGAIPEATAGRLMTTFDLSDSQDPPPRDDQITIAHAADTVPLCGSAIICGPGPIFRGNAVVTWAKFTYSAAIWDVPSVHEIAHVLGMCHINGDLTGGRPNNSLMGSLSVLPTSGPDSHAPRLSAWDIEALQAVYGSPLSPGAVKSDFVAAGLAKP